MAGAPYIFSSESVTEGHPDKMCDQISDSVLDALLAQDERSRVECETMISTGLVVVVGEITTNAEIKVADIVRKTIADIGYVDSSMGFDAATCEVMVSLHAQSSDIARGVDTGGAGDQGMMFGYACDETQELMPVPIMIAHRLTERLSEVRKDGTLTWLRPDGKSQVSVAYAEGRPIAVKTVVVSTQHAPDIETPDIAAALREHVIDPVLERSGLESDGLRLLVNPTGKFVIGGPQGDAGLTGRKIIVDTYGGYARHGGGAFSGKDPSKVDRSASYAARWVAKSIVAAGFARRCEVQLAYAIGVAEPVSIMVDTFNTGKVSDQALEQAIRSVFDLTPGGIVEALDLRNPIYRPTAVYGHFGREAEKMEVHGKNVELFTWENPSRTKELEDAVRRVA